MPFWIKKRSSSDPTDRLLLNWCEDFKLMCVIVLQGSKTLVIQQLLPLISWRIGLKRLRQTCNQITESMHTNQQASSLLIQRWVEFNDFFLIDTCHILTGLRTPCLFWVEIVHDWQRWSCYQYTGNDGSPHSSESSRLREWQYKQCPTVTWKQMRSEDLLQGVLFSISSHTLMSSAVSK